MCTVGVVLVALTCRYKWEKIKYRTCYCVLCLLPAASTGIINN